MLLQIFKQIHKEIVQDERQRCRNWLKQSQKHCGRLEKGSKRKKTFTYLTAEEILHSREITAKHGGE